MGMIPLALMAMVALASSVGLAASGWLVPAAALHIALAMGILPLILGAMLHFIPVLTRSDSPHPVIGALPLVAQCLGAVVVGALQGWLPRWPLHAAATAISLLAVVLLLWLGGRVRHCVGKPHPGWFWYASALGVLIAAMVAVTFMDGEFGRPARLFHMHANTLGWIGLTALGTLPVLLPTVIGRPDTGSAAWLRRWWLPMLVGALMVAAGAAWLPALAVPAALVMLAGVGLLCRQWWLTFGWAALAGDAAALSLGLAALGWCALLLLGVLHGLGLIPGRPAIAGFFACFLLPLVSGALTQLLPVWRYPGPISPARRALRARLAAGGRLRALLFVAGGLAWLADFALAGELLVGAGLLLFAWFTFAPRLWAR